jgi:hypothetical protein
MNKVYNIEKDKWLRPWNLKTFDNLYNRDDRFFAIILKGALAWLNKNILMYDEPIQHYIYNTGSSYLYIESNGYEFSWNETTGEDQMYMKLPRCICNIDNISIPLEELTSPFSMGNYERLSSDNTIKGYAAEIRRIPIQMSISLDYYLSNFNESIILIQEFIDKILFQKYFNVIYLGNQLQCSIEFPQDFNIELNKIDMTSPDVNQKHINIKLNIETNYPQINLRTEILQSKVIESFGYSNDPDYTERKNGAS